MALKHVYAVDTEHSTAHNEQPVSRIDASNHAEQTAAVGKDEARRLVRPARDNDAIAEHRRRLEYWWGHAKGRWVNCHVGLLLQCPARRRRGCELGKLSLRLTKKARAAREQLSVVCEVSTEHLKLTPRVWLHDTQWRHRSILVLERES